MNKRHRMTGFVTSNKMQKTVVVEIRRSYRHPLYLKVVHSRKKVMAHDELGCEVGDLVQIVESRPISKRKRWVVEKILRRETASAEDLIEPELRGEEPESESLPAPIRGEESDEPVQEESA